MRHKGHRTRPYTRCLLRESQPRPISADLDASRLCERRRRLRREWLRVRGGAEGGRVSEVGGGREEGGGGQTEGGRREEGRGGGREEGGGGWEGGGGSEVGGAQRLERALLQAVQRAIEIGRGRPRLAAKREVVDDVVVVVGPARTAESRRDRPRVTEITEGQVLVGTMATAAAAACGGGVHRCGSVQRRAACVQRLAVCV